MTNRTESTTLPDGTEGQREIAEAEDELSCEEKLKLAAQEIRELREALRKELHFQRATELPKVPYVSAGNAYGFYKTLLQASMEATKTDDYWRKIIFKIASDGRLFDPELEAEREEKEGPI